MAKSVNMSRRKFLTEPLPKAMVAAAGLSAGVAAGPPASERPPSSFVMLEDFGVIGSETRDVSSAVQSAIDTTAKNGGGVVMCPPGTFYVKKLVVPNNVCIQGAGIGATTLMLPNSANTDLLQQAGFAENKRFANMYFTLRDITLNGNKAKNKKGNLIVLRGYRGLLERVRLTQAAGHGILVSEKGKRNAPNLNGLAENAVRGCFFDQCDGAGIYAANHKGNRIADMFITDNVFNSNGRSGFYQIDLERSAGFHIKGNQMYRSHSGGDLRALKAGALIVALNNFTGKLGEDRRDVSRQVYVETRGWGNAIINGNLFHALQNAEGPESTWHQLELDVQAGSSVIVSGNSFYSDSNAKVVRSISRLGAGKDAVIISGNTYGGASRSPEGQELR